MSDVKNAFLKTASLLHNNLAASSAGCLACVHNSVTQGQCKLLIHSAKLGVNREIDIAQAYSIRYLDLPFGQILCVSSCNGTRIYTEDGQTLLLYCQVSNAPGLDPMALKFHQGACYIAATQQIVIGTSTGSVLPIQAAFATSLGIMAESPPSTAATAVVDLCSNAAANTVISAHDNGDLRVWNPIPGGALKEGSVVQNCGQVPVRICMLGIRLAVAFGAGTVCLYDALSLQRQVEISSHTKLLTAMAVREDAGIIATVSEDTFLNLWQVDPASGIVTIVHSEPVVDKLLTGVALGPSGVVISAYDSDEIFHASVF